MSRHPAFAAAACVAVAVVGSVGLIACDSSSSEPAEASPSASANTADYAWAVGSHGITMATTDGGAHWATQTSGTDHGLSGVSFADTKHGWAVGGWADPASSLEPVTLILATTDGGSHWVAQSEAAGEPLGKVACVDASHVWVTGGGQTAKIMASSDGGQTWMTQYTGDAVGQILDIAFTDELHGWAVSSVGPWMESQAAEVLATTDGGSHWQVQTTLRGIPGWAIVFADMTHGWVVGSQLVDTYGQGESSAQVWSTSDGGQTWTPAPAPQGMIASVETAACSDSEHVWIGAAGPDAFFRSTDGGRTWLTPTKSIDAAGVVALAFSDSSRGWAVTLDGSLTRILGTTDGGVSWTRQARARVGQPTGNTPQLTDITCLSAVEGSDK